MPQVMLLRNLDSSHVNGSRGVVLELDAKVRGGGGRTQDDE